ncbi:MAG: alanine/ornithine racemase family PLP-dependent enzyme [Defluviitaleaceae bacterium]|nr:alanine/ornithine racemase family PLP-dependent enzyme [Defluviitaleaceae bacterium]MCL2837138.1 alanine/ornithine racemase family PLP-dependent enzyme [Defluviitaleaceae bacterium]
MKYPALITNTAKLAENINIIQKICAENNISFCAVTKSFCAAPGMTGVYYKAGVRDFADTRLPNLRKINYPGVTKWLLRLPMLSEAEEVVETADISLNSETATVEALSGHAVKLGRKHKIILMVDVGDLREGVLPGDAVNIAGEMLKLPGIELHGIGVNYNCFGGVIPTLESLNIITGVVKEITGKYGVNINVISGGNSGSMHLLTSRTMPEEITNLRLGEVVFFGRETSYQQLIPHMHEDIFRLDAQIIELKKKPSMPVGEIGLNAFGEEVVFCDRGDMLRAIVACGRQDVDIGKIKPLEPGVEILGQSSDHMILNVTDADKPYKVGGVISFSIAYGALLSLSTSEYVYKVYE